MRDGTCKEADGADTVYEDCLARGEVGATGSVYENRERFGECCLVETTAIG
jgi:hypothetical protein